MSLAVGNIMAAFAFGWVVVALARLMLWSSPPMARRVYVSPLSYLLAMSTVLAGGWVAGSLRMPWYLPLISGGSLVFFARRAAFAVDLTPPARPPRAARRGSR